MPSDTDRGQKPDSEARPPRPMVQRVGAVLWPSFFAAGVATMVFFAGIDPLDLAGISMPGLEISRELGYSIGFFMFWACTASSSLFTWLLLGRPGRGPTPPPRGNRP